MIFLPNPSTNLNETWNIVTRIDLYENWQKIFKKSPRKKLQRHSIFHIRHKSDSLSETKISDSLSEIKIRDAMSETKQKVTLCIRQKSYSLPITKFHV